MSISSRTRKIKDCFGWNNVELGKAAGVTKAAVGRWINEDMPPGRDALIRLRERYSINDDWFLNARGDMLVYPLSSQASHEIKALQASNKAKDLYDLTLDEQKEIRQFVGYLLWKRNRNNKAYRHNTVRG